MAKFFSMLALLCAGASLFGCVVEDDYGRYPRYEGDRYYEHGPRYDDRGERMERERRFERERDRY